MILNIPTLADYKTNEVNPSEALSEIYEYEAKKSPKEKTIDFTRAFVRENKKASRKSYYLFTCPISEAENGTEALLIVDIKNMNTDKETVVYYVVGIANRTLQPMTNKYFKVLRSAMNYIATLCDSVLEDHELITSLAFEQHVEKIENTFNNNHMKAVFMTEINTMSDILLAEQPSLTPKSLLAKAVSFVLEKEPYYISSYIQSFNTKVSPLEAEAQHFL